MTIIIKLISIIFFQLKPFDKELEAFDDTLSEFPVSFPPSYPFEEKLSEATSYMQTRCPAWCDRVLLSKTAKKLISETDKVEYNLLGFNTCMGDHKVGIDSTLIRCYAYYYLLFSSIITQPVYLDFHMLVSN